MYSGKDLVVLEYYVRMLVNENERYTISEFLTRNNLSAEQIRAMSVYNIQLRFHLDYKSAAYIADKLKVAKTSITLLAKHPLSYYLKNAKMVEFASRTTDFMEVLITSFLQFNPNREILLFYKLPLTIYRLQKLPQAFLTRISVFNLNQYNIYNSLELIYEKARATEIQLIIFDSAFELLQDGAKFNQILARLSHDAAIVCFNQLVEHPFERGEFPAFREATAPYVYCAAQNLSTYYVEKSPTAKQFGVIRLGKLFSPGYFGRCTLFDIRVIEFGGMYYVWDGRAQMWIVAAPEVHEV